MKCDSVESLISKCAEASESGTDIYIVGAGKYGRKIAEILNENKINWNCFVDKFKTGECMNKPILAYEAFNTGGGICIISVIERYRDSVLNDLKNISGVSDEKRIVYLGEGAGFYVQGIWAEDALKYVLKKFEFNTVLDAGCGEGLHSNIFLDNGKHVTALDYGQSWYFKKMKDDSGIKLITSDINLFESEEQFDLVWCSHLLEHQLNQHNFLCKLRSLVKENGILAITVPHFSTQERVQGGHVSVWSAGLLLYQLVLAGFDCSKAHVKSYEGQVSVIVEKRTICVLDKINYDRGDIRIIRPFLPEDIVYINAGDDDHFYGDIQCLNWFDE